MAEWSKALDSSSSLHLKAWVRIPPEPYYCTALVAQLDSASDFESGGCRFESCRGCFLPDLGLGFPAKGAPSAPEEPEDRTFGGLAQSVECVVCNDEAPGSKPGFSSSFTVSGILAEWLRRQIRNLLGYARVGSNPTDVVAGLA